MNCTFQPFGVGGIGLKTDGTDVFPAPPIVSERLEKDFVDGRVRVFLRLEELSDLYPNVGANVEVHVIAPVC